MKNKDVIVVGGDHYNTLWVARSLGLAGFTPIVLVVDKDKKKSFVTKTKYAKASYVVNSEIEIINLLYSFKFDERIPLFCSSDGSADAIDKEYYRLKEKYYLANCSEKQGMLSYWMDKKVMIECAERAGFTIPWSKEIEISENVTHVEEFPFPCIVKPLKSSAGSKSDFRICHTKDELQESLDSLRFHCNHVLIQEYLKPDFEISILCMRIRDKQINLIPGLLHKVGTCRSVHNLGMPTYAFVEKEILPYIDRSIVDKFLNKIDYDGLYSIEFFVSHRIAYFLEINLRVDGDLFVYTTSGVNMPQLWATNCYRQDISKLSMDLKNKTYGMTEISYLKYLPWRNPLKVLKDWWRTDCYSIFSWNDPLPFIYKFIYSI